MLPRSFYEFSAEQVTGLDKALERPNSVGSGHGSVACLKRFCPWIIPLLNKRMPAKSIQQGDRGAIQQPMISLRARIIRFASKQYFKRISPHSDVQKLRAELAAIGRKIGPARGVQIRHANIAGIDCEWLVPDGCEGAPLIYYLHGGAYVMGSPQTHRKMVSHIAKHAGMRALLPDYRLAPENPFPAALEDSTNVYRSLIEGGAEASEVIIGGDSAGGNLSMATLLALRDAGDELPAACFLMSPWLDLAAEGGTLVTRAEEDPWFRPADLPAIVSKYCSEFDKKNPLVSPVYANAANLPPTLIQVGDHEILLSDSTRLADNISEAGGDVTLQVWPDMWHVFQFFVGQMPESKRAIKDIARFLKMQFDDSDRVENQAA